MQSRVRANRLGLGRDNDSCFHPERVIVSSRGSSPTELVSQEVFDPEKGRSRYGTQRKGEHGLVLPPFAVHLCLRGGVTHLSELYDDWGRVVAEAERRAREAGRGDVVD